MTDYKQLCAELLAALESWSPNGGAPLEEGAEAIAEARLIERARAALSQPEPAGLSDEELMELMPQQFRDDLATVSRIAAHGAGPDVGAGLFRVSLNTGALEFARTAIAADRAQRQPVPPEPGEVGGLIKCLRIRAASLSEVGANLSQQGDAIYFTRAADLLEQRQPEPAPGEVEE